MRGDGFADLRHRSRALFVGGDVGAEVLHDHAEFLRQRFGEALRFAAGLAAPEVEADDVHAAAREFTRGGGAEAGGCAEDDGPFVLEIAFGHGSFYSLKFFRTRTTLSPSASTA
jgi:hypothetical protein